MSHRLHDLLCPVDKPQAQQIELQGRWVDPGSVVCICERLERVRQDERGQPSDWITPRLHTERMRENYDAGYAAALRDAVEAVPHDRDCDAVHYKDEPCNCWRPQAVAAIEAISADRNPVNSYSGQWERDLYGGAS